MNHTEKPGAMSEDKMPHDIWVAVSDGYPQHLAGIGEISVDWFHSKESAEANIEMLDSSKATVVRYVPANRAEKLEAALREYFKQVDNGSIEQEDEAYNALRALLEPTESPKQT